MNYLSKHLIEAGGTIFLLYIGVGAVCFVIATLSSRRLASKWKNPARLAIFLLLAFFILFFFPPRIAVPHSGRDGVFYAEVAGVAYGLLSLFAWPTACIVSWIIDVVKNRKNTEQEV